MKTFKLWAGGDVHVGVDLRGGRDIGLSEAIRNPARRSLADAILQAERGGDEGGPRFQWDVMLDIGDVSGSGTPPEDEEGLEVVRQYAVSRSHPREDFYNVAGNHDASGAGQPCMGWFRKWVDPAGENPRHSGVYSDRRPYPIEGTWERYSFQVGNMLFLAMSDRNDGGPPVGRGPRGGYPAGAVTQETFEWWVEMVEANQDKTIISAHHHVLKETTVGSGPWEGSTGSYHGRFDDGGPEGASYLHFVGGVPDACAFESYLEDHPGAIDLWIGGHTHTFPDDTYNGRSHVERKWGVTFINAGSLLNYGKSFEGIPEVRLRTATQRWRETKRPIKKNNVPMSRLLTFTEGSRKVNVRCHLHTSDYAPQGWYDRVERAVQIRKPFSY